MDFQELLTAIAKFSDRKRETRNARTKRLELENTTTLILKKKNTLQKSEDLFSHKDVWNSR